jgi:hypothetical protein
MKARAALLLTAIGALGVGCGIRIQRDLSEVQPSAVIYDDMCGLQDYFDTLATTTLAAPTEVFAQDLEKEDSGRAIGGRARYRFASEFQLKHLRRLLQQNWRRLPKEVMEAKDLALEVRWSTRAGAKRVVTTQDAEIVIGQETWDLPYHVCLSDLLFGSDLYKTRRQVLGLPLPPPSPLAKPDKAGDGSASVASPTTDGGIMPAGATVDAGRPRG